MLNKTNISAGPLQRTALLVAVYVIQLVFFQTLMSPVHSSGVLFHQYTGSQKHSSSSNTADYRMLLKHESEKHSSDFNIPTAIAFSPIILPTANEQASCNFYAQPGSGRLSDRTFRRYLRLRSMLI